MGLLDRRTTKEQQQQALSSRAPLTHYKIWRYYQSASEACAQVLQHLILHQQGVSGRS